VATLRLYHHQGEVVVGMGIAEEVVEGVDGY